MTSEEGSRDSYNYYVNLCRPLLPMPGTNCPAGAWACRIAKKADQHTGKHDVQVKWPAHFKKDETSVSVANITASFHAHDGVERSEDTETILAKGINMTHVSVSSTRFSVFFFLCVCAEQICRSLHV